MRKLGLLSAVPYIAQSATRSGMYSPEDNYRLQSSKGATIGNWRSFSHYNRYNLQSDTSSLAGPSFNPNGTEMWTCANTGANTAAIRRYALSTPFDVSTGSLSDTYSNSSSNYTSTNPSAIYTSENYVNVVDTAGDAVYTYDRLSTGRLHSIISSSVKSYSISAVETSASGIFFKDDGTKMYTTGQTGQGVDEFNLSTAWDVTTASHSYFFSTSSQDSLPRDLFFKPDGTKMWIIGDTNDRIYEYTLSTAWDLSTASYSNNFATLSGGAANSQLSPETIFWTPDGLSIIIYSNYLRYINKFTVTTAWSLTGFAYSTQSNSIASSITSTGFAAGMTYNDDGTRLIFASSLTDTIMEFNMQTAYGTVVLDRIGTFSLQEVNSTGIYIGNNGYNVYYVGTTDDRVYQYDLNLPYKVTVKDHRRSLSISSQTTSPSGITFSSDGTKMWVADIVNDYILQYTCSTPFAGNTATYDSVRLTTSTGSLLSGGVTTSPAGTVNFDNEPYGVAIDRTGKWLFFGGNQVDTVYVFKLATSNSLGSWDGSFSRIVIPGNQFGTAVSAFSGLALSSDDRTLIITDNNTDDIIQLDLNF